MRDFQKIRADFAYNLRHWKYLRVTGELEEQFENVIFKDWFKFLTLLCDPSGVSGMKQKIFLSADNRAKNCTK